jgi:hypothetical protein
MHAEAIQPGQEKKAENLQRDIAQLASKYGLLDHPVLHLEEKDLLYWGGQFAQQQVSWAHMDERFAAMKFVLDTAQEYRFLIATKGDLSFWAEKILNANDPKSAKAGIVAAFSGGKQERKMEKGEECPLAPEALSPNGVKALPANISWKKIRNQRIRIGRAEKNQLAQMLTEGIRQTIRPTEEQTGWIRDRMEPGTLEQSNETSIDNVGITVMNLALAGKTGMLAWEYSRERVYKALQTLDAYQLKYSFHGIPYTWANLKNLDEEGLPTPLRNENAVLDGGNLYGFLLVTQMVFREDSEINSLLQRIINRFYWQAFVTNDNNNFYGGAHENEINHTWVFRREYNESWFAYLAGVGLGVLNPEAMCPKSTNQVWAYGFCFDGVGQPGIKAGGLFLPGLPFLFMDHTEYANELANMSAALIAHSLTHNYRVQGKWVWGTSAAADPVEVGPYLGYGKVVPSNVNPHAVALALEIFPARAMEALQALQDLGVITANGPLDAFSMLKRTKARTVTAWDLGLYNAALMNYLHDGVIRKYFKAHPIVQSAIQHLPHYAVSEPAKDDLAYILDQMEAVLQYRTFDKNQILLEE